jgi:hypothetical protein
VHVAPILTSWRQPRNPLTVTSSAYARGELTASYGEMAASSFTTSAASL